MKTHAIRITTTFHNLISYGLCMMVVILLVLVLSGPAAAALTVNSYVEDHGRIHPVAAIQPTLTGATMAGALVTVGQATSSLTETVGWVPTGPGSGGAHGTLLGWHLSLTGDTEGNPLILNGRGTNGIDWIEIDLMPKRQVGVFDDVEPSPGTPGSLRGTDPWTGIDSANSHSSLGWDIDVTYKDAVTLIGSVPQKDVYRRMRIDFTRSFIGDDRLVFLADSDGIRPIPEPASCLLLAMGGLVAGCCLRRRHG